MMMHSFRGIKRKADCEEHKTQPTKKQRICAKCKETLDVELFGTSMSRLDRLQTQCKPCSRKQYDTMGARLRKLLKSANSNTAFRQLNNEAMPENTLTLENLVELYDKQEGLCWYSGVAMSTITGGAFLMSLERLNNSESYTKSNCVLIIVILNQGFKDCSQWSQRKAVQLLSLVRENRNWDDSYTELFYIKNRNPRSRNAPENENGDKWCKTCEAYLPTTQFFGNRKHRLCKQCKRQEDRKRKETLRMFVISSLGGARCSTKYRIKQGRNMEAVAIDPQWYLDQMNLQRGLCYISRVPMTFKPNSE